VAPRPPPLLLLLLLLRTEPGARKAVTATNANAPAAAGAPGCRPAGRIFWSRITVCLPHRPRPPTAIALHNLPPFSSLAA